MRALYLSAFSSNLGDRQSSIFMQREGLNSLAKRSPAVKISRELFPVGIERDFSEPATWGTEFDIVLVGGAGLLGPRIFAEGWSALRSLDRPIAILGVGENVPNSMHLLPASRPGRPVFVGLRHTDSVVYFPCPSLANDGFLKRLNDAPQRLVAGYFHHRRRSRIARFMPHSIKNNRHALEDALLHLSSARLIVTDSYHGALWGRALGSRVLLLDRWSRRKAKFRAFPSSKNGNLNDLRDRLVIGLEKYAAWVAEHNLLVSEDKNGARGREHR